MEATGDNRSGLSASQSLDTGPTISRVKSRLDTNGDQASVLIKALKDFVLPLVYVQPPGLISAGQNNNDIEYPTMGPEARQLVNALENFIASLVKPQSGQGNENKTKKGDGLPEKELAGAQSTVDVDTSSPSVWEDQGQRSRIQMARYTERTPVEAMTSEKPRVLRLALVDARSHVFNKMPIRLLAFNSDGSGIRLVDRNEIWHHISTLMEVGFNEDQRKGIYVHKENMENSELITLHARYAILSHTWLHDTPGEVTYADWKSGKFDINSPGYQKLANFCKIAATEHGVTLGWMDTICINKESSSELDESIRSMYKWYRNARICITYLAQTTTLQRMRDDPWFTRGWTLQELIAPLSSKFYDAHWQQLVPGMRNDKYDDLIKQEIQAATTITPYELDSLEVENIFQVLHTNDTGIPISRRMQWAANRQVTREEDTAYSLMGIFNVSMTTAYGEGSQRAFLRLLQEILKSSIDGVQDVVNWGYGPDLEYCGPSLHASSLIPSSPKQYLWRAEEAIHWPVPIIPVAVTHLGLHLSVLIMPAISANPSPQGAGFDPIGNYYATVDIGKGSFVHSISTLMVEFPSRYYNVLEFDNSALSPDMETQTPGRAQIILGVLNFTTTESSVILPSGPCFAVWLKYVGSGLTEAVALRGVEKVQYTNGIAFNLQSRELESDGRIPKDELAKHGMELHTIYL